MQDTAHASFVAVLGALVAKRDWLGVHDELQRCPPSEGPVFVDNELRAVVFNGLVGAHQQPQVVLTTRQAAGRRNVMRALFPTVQAAAKHMNGLAPRARPRQLDELFEAIWHSVNMAEMAFSAMMRGDEQSSRAASYINSELQSSSLYKSSGEQCTDRKMVSLLKHMSKAAVAQLTPRSARTCVVEQSSCDEHDGKVLHELLVHRPDLNVNMLLEDGTPAWFTPDRRLLWFSYSMPGVDVNTPFTLHGVTGPLLLHLAHEDVSIPHIATLGYLRGRGARPLDVTVASQEPCASYVIRAFEQHVHTEFSAKHFFAVNAIEMAALGLLLRPQDEARMTARLGADSIALASILSSFAEYRWTRRETVLRVLFEATQEPELDLEPDLGPKRYSTTADAVSSPMLMAVLRDWNTRRAPPLDSSTPFALCNELAGKVMTFVL